MRSIPVFACDASRCTLPLIRRLQRFLPPNGSKVFLFPTRPRCLIQLLSPPERTADTATRSQPMTTAAAVNGSEHSFSPFRNHNEWRYFSKGKIQIAPYSSQEKTCSEIWCEGMRIHRYKPFYGYLTHFLDNHPIRAAKWAGETGVLIQLAARSIATKSLCPIR